MEHNDKKCLGGAGAPCLISGKCPLCCQCKYHAQRSTKLARGGAKPVDATCAACGSPMAFPMGHALVCEKSEGAFIPEGRP